MRDKHFIGTGSGPIAERIGLDIEDMKASMGVNSSFQDTRFAAALEAALDAADNFCSNHFKDKAGNPLPIPKGIAMWVQSVVARHIGFGVNGTKSQTITGSGTVHLDKLDYDGLAAYWIPGVS